MITELICLWQSICCKQIFPFFCIYLKFIYICNEYKFTMNTIITKEQVIDRLNQFGIKPSIQRIAILKYLLEHRTHPAIDEIYEALSKKMITLSKTTIYNTLQLLESKGAILSILIDDKMVHYDGYPEPHAHFMCNNCRKIFDIEQKFEYPTNNTTLKKFKVSEVQIYYKGICNLCLTK